MKHADNGQEDFVPDMFELDKNRLDEEWLVQSKLVYRAGKAEADARESWERAKVARDVAKDDLKKVCAELDRRVRRDPASFGMEKTTDAAVASMILLQDQYEQAQAAVYQAEEKVIKKRHVLDLCETEMKALDPNRLRSLENLAELDKRGYFSQPRPPKDPEVAERVQKLLRKKGQRRASGK